MYQNATDINILGGRRFARLRQGINLELLDEFHHFIEALLTQIFKQGSQQKPAIVARTMDRTKGYRGGYKKGVFSQFVTGNGGERETGKGGRLNKKGMGGSQEMHLRPKIRLCDNAILLGLAITCCFSEPVASSNLRSKIPQCSIPE